MNADSDSVVGVLMIEDVSAHEEICAAVGGELIVDQDVHSCVDAHLALYETRR